MYLFVCLVRYIYDGYLNEYFQMGEGVLLWMIVGSIPVFIGFF